MTYLTPDSGVIQSSSNPSSISILKTNFSSTSSNAEISFFTRFKIMKEEQNFINLMETALRRLENNILFLFRLRFNISTSKFEIQIQENNQGVKTFHKYSKPMAINQWYVISISFNFIKGTASLFVAVDDLQLTHTTGKYAYIGANSDIESIYPDTSHGNSF
jgi:hypothetical protein